MSDAERVQLLAVKLIRYAVRNSHGEAAAITMMSSLAEKYGDTPVGRRAEELSKGPPPD